MIQRARLLAGFFAFVFLIAGATSASSMPTSLELAPSEPAPSEPAPSDMDREAPGSQESVGTSALLKRAVPSGRLLLPFFEVDTLTADGKTTLWAVRSNALQPITLVVDYYEADAPQLVQRRDIFSLDPKEIKTVNVRFVENLEVGPDGFARGFATFQVVSDIPGDFRIQGDFFLITPGESFASGTRLVNIDPASTHNELCRSASIRFMQGGGFTGGTTYRVWFEAETPPMGENPVVSYAVYSEAGGDPILEAELPVEESAFEVDIATLLGPFQGSVSFGAVEFAFSGTVGDPPRNRLGSVSGVLDALGSYSVGIEASCNE